jgi:hypothetical protein
MSKLKRLSSRPTDVNQAAFQMVQESTAEPKKSRRPTKLEISRIMSAMGTKGGKKGGKRSLVTMTPEQRRDRALLAAKARWKNKKTR